MPDGTLPRSAKGQAIPEAGDLTWKQGAWKTESSAPGVGEELATTEGRSSNEVEEEERQEVKIQGRTYTHSLPYCSLS